MKFRIEGVAGDGKERNGTIEATNEEDALRKAKEAGIFVSRIEPVVAPKLPSAPSRLTSKPTTAGNGVLVSSGPICADYEVLGMVIGFVSQTEGCSGGIPVENVYRSALQRLIESAQAVGANGLMHVNFQNRVANGIGCESNKKVFEVFAWGTAIRF